MPRETGIRFWTLGTYLIAYRGEKGMVEIVRVLSGYRDINAILGDPD